MSTMSEPANAGNRKYGLRPGRSAALTIANPDIQNHTASAAGRANASRETSTPTAVTPSANAMRSDSGKA